MKMALVKGVDKSKDQLGMKEKGVSRHVIIFLSIPLGIQFLAMEDKKTSDAFSLGKRVCMGDLLSSPESLLIYSAC